MIKILRIERIKSRLRLFQMGQVGKGIDFCIFFCRARVCWPLLCLFRPFSIFERCLEELPSHSKQACNKLSHPSLYRNRWPIVLCTVYITTLWPPYTSTKQIFLLEIIEFIGELYTCGNYGDSSHPWMRCSRVARVSDSQCRSRNCPGFDPSVLRHRGIWGAADKAVLNKVHT